MRDITLADTVYIGFSTRSFSTGAPTTLAGVPVISAYEDAGLTQITAGITLGVDHDGVTGLHMITLVATGANGYENDKDYNLVITTGTVGGVSVVGEVVGQFSIQRAPVNWANVSNPTTALDLSGTDIQLVDTATTVTGGATSAAQTTAQNDLDIITDSDGTIIGAAAVDLIWDEVLTGATHNVNNSSGKRLRQVDAAFTVHAGTAQAGTATTITLDALAEATDNIYRGDRVIIVGGTGVEEHGIIVSYVGSTKVATMAETWAITPDATSEFELTPASVDVETWQHNVVTVSAGGLPDVNVNEVGDTAQTAGDIAALINALQDLSAAQVNAEVDTALVDFFTSSAQLVDDVWDEVISKAAHNVAQSAAKALRQSGDLIQIAGAISDVSPTTTDFDTDLTQADTFFADSFMVFVNGAANAGIGKVVSTYVNASGHVTFTASMAWPVTPVNGDDFVIIALHSHPITEIQAGLATEAKQDIIDANLDTVESRTPTAAQLVYMVANAAVGLPVTFSGTGTTTTCTLALVDGSTPSSTNDQYNGRVLIFNLGTLNQVATDITAYNGTTKVATVTAVPVAITSAHTARLV